MRCSRQIEKVEECNMNENLNEQKAVETIEATEEIKEVISNETASSENKNSKKR